MILQSDTLQEPSKYVVVCLAVDKLLTARRLTLISVSIVLNWTDWPPTTPQYCCGISSFPPTTTVVAPSLFAMEIWQLTCKCVRTRLWGGATYAEEGAGARTSGRSISQGSSAGPLGQGTDRPLLMMTTFFGSNNGS